MNTNMTKSQFDAVAAEWDDNPVRRELTKAVADAVLKGIPFKPEWSVLDYGCGTGALSAMLAGKSHRIVAADSSEGMLEQVRRKAAVAALKNVSPLFLDLENQAPLDEKFDMIILSMALHHIRDIETVVRKLSAMLASGGWFVAADLIKEDGSFHADMAAHHRGFDPEELGCLISSAGLKAEAHAIVYTIRKNEREYPVFIMFARKNGGLK